MNVAKKRTSKEERRGRSPRSSDAVSYTHLDVYKRQHRHDTRYKASKGEGAQTNTEANMEVQETQPTTEMEVATNNTLENQ